MLRDRALVKRQVLTVSELTRDIKLILDNSFPEVWVSGEVSNLSKPSSGHIYFTLKDPLSQIRAVFFKNENIFSKFELKDGMEVLLFGRVGVYEKSGNYQLYVKAVEPRGVGALQLALEQLKEKLAKEGLFSEARKKPIPAFPRKLAFITSSTGAVIHDMLSVLKRRAVSADVILFSVPVQGKGAAEEISRAVKLANNAGGFDCIVIARGGGSLEDLWEFNSETLARSIAESKIPTVSAVGHQVDWTICDLVADMRAPTPSAAIEMIMPSGTELKERIADFTRRLESCMQDLVPQYEQRIDEFLIAINRNLKQVLEIKNISLKGLSDRLVALSPLNVLARGYSITFDKASGRVIKDVNQVALGSDILTVLSKGELESKVSARTAEKGKS